MPVEDVHAFLHAEMSIFLSKQCPLHGVDVELGSTWGPVSGFLQYGDVSGLEFRHSVQRGVARAPPFNSW